MFRPVRTVAAVVGVMAAAGCTLLGGPPYAIDDNFYGEGGASAQTGTGSSSVSASSSSSASASSGSVQPGCNSTTCTPLEPSNDCQFAACVNDECVPNSPVSTSTPCSTAGGKVCDGKGACVECVEVSQCPYGQVCKEGGCFGSTCSDGEPGPGESDVDCGGSCPACAVGKLCGTGGDCASKLCIGGSCKACAGTSDCSSLGAYYCAAPDCVPKKGLAAGCASDDECASGNCQLIGLFYLCGI